MTQSCQLLSLAALSAICAAYARNMDGSGLRIQDQQGQQYSYHGGDDLPISTPGLARPAPIFPHAPAQPPSGFIALGDSYSAGIGTGFNGTEHPCRLGLHAHPVLLYQDLLELVAPNESSFQFLSCTGSTVEDMLQGSERSQIDEFNTSTTADFALLSLLFWHLRRSAQKVRGSPSRSQFESSLRLAITEILDRVHWEKRPWFTITVTGYARFFNSETRLCDDLSFGIWWRGPKLKRHLRRRMNNMVLGVNAKIKSAVEAINSEYATSKVYFVDYDHLFEGHRFCEKGVTEPDYQRNETWFFLVGGRDNGDEDGDEDDMRLEALQRPVPPDSPLRNPSTCMEAAMRSGDWGERAVCYMAMATKRDPTLRLASGKSVSTQDMWYVPTYYGQTFHPRTKGHEAVKDQIYRRWHGIPGHLE